MVTISLKKFVCGLFVGWKKNKKLTMTLCVKSHLSVDGPDGSDTVQAPIKLKAQLKNPFFIFKKSD